MTERALFLEGLGAELSFEPQPDGGFVHVGLSQPRSRARVALGKVRELRRFAACFRPEPFWMQPYVGSRTSEVPGDTQFLLLELDDGRFAVVAPLVDPPFKATLVGAEDMLWLVLDSGDSAVEGQQMLGAYLGVGDDPYELCRRGARAVAERLAYGKLRREKPLPKLVDYFGWCTWDAFYQDVSQTKVEQGLASFREGGVSPRWLILDDGWQTVRAREGAAARLTGFAANDKFPGGLADTIAMARRYGVEQFWVWHALHGYWGGIDADALPDYGVDDVSRSYAPEVLEHRPEANHEYWGSGVGRPSLAELPRFYEDYHRYLAEQGVSGVKVDNQASVEALSQGQGGRVTAAFGTRAALERSTSKHFGGALINCMACSSELLYATRDSTLCRTSTDFWPNRPETHGVHVHTNALVGLWFGELVHPDWDMFQSGHPVGAFHAAARAVSGGPVYVSDKPDAHDFDLLRELVCSDGRVLRAEGVAVPALDSLFTDPIRQPRLFKVVNRNRHGWVIGLFNAQSPGAPAVSGSVSAADVPALPEGEFALYLKRKDALRRVSRTESVAVELSPLSAEIVTIALMDRGVAVLGLADKLNGGAAVLSGAWTGDDYVIDICDGGRLLCFSERRPTTVLDENGALTFVWQHGRLDVTVTPNGPRRIRLGFGSPA
ncbi:MAG: Sip1-related alpha-galactosidase [Myxococcales bacterium]